MCKLAIPDEEECESGPSRSPSLRQRALIEGTAIRAFRWAPLARGLTSVDSSSAFTFRSARPVRGTNWVSLRRCVLARNAKDRTIVAPSRDARRLVPSDLRSKRCFGRVELKCYALLWRG
ncbi:hypothetical protein MRX96_008918 [Rhipicephalus microplus]